MTLNTGLYRRSVNSLRRSFRENEVSYVTKLLTFTEMGSNHIDLNCRRSNKTSSTSFIAINATSAGAQITISQMSVCCGSFFRRIYGGEKMVSRSVVVEQEWRSKMECSAIDLIKMTHRNS